MHSVTRTIFPLFAFKFTHRVILFTQFCKLLTRVATLSGGGARASSASMARRLCSTLRRASQRHPEVAARAEQYSQNRPPGTEAVPCQTADASTTLAAGSTQNWLQSVCVDIQDSEHVCTAVPQPTHQPPRQCTDTTLDSYATAHPTVRSYRLRETFFSTCRAVCLELTSRICHRKRLIVCIQI